MSTRLITCHVVDCDVCKDSLEGGDRVLVFDTPEQGSAYAIDCGWTDLGGGRHACNMPDPAHDAARTTARTVTEVAS